MKKKFVFGLMFGAAFLFASCGGETKPADAATEQSTTNNESEEADVADYDPHRGEGKFDENNLQISGLDAAMATKGESISQTKCFSCHKITEERLVGPGWKDLTNRRTPHWIMNFITNPDAMLDKDPALQEQLELCMVRMPDQNLADQEAREILEYMRKIDGAK
ncbi:MAG: c-type cytochrome [Crocinitomicaceae bacterium]|nr:c-type cytochrome [Crocinitomicaceae bacterium]